MNEREVKLYALKLYALLEVVRQRIDRAEQTNNAHDFIQARLKLNEAKELIKKGLKDDSN